MIKDILEYLKNNRQLRIMQGLIRIDTIFRDYIVKDWTGDSDKKWFAKYNKVIIRN